MSRGEKHGGADIYLRGKKWWGRWRQGKNLPPIRQSLDTNSAELAAELWQDREREIRFGITKRKEISLGDACHLYWTEHVVPQRLRSADLVKYYGERAIKYLGAATLLTKITRQRLLAYCNHLVASKHLAPSVINQHIKFVPRICAFAERAGYVAPHFAGLGKRGSDRILVRDDAPAPRTIDSEAEQKAILEGFACKAPDLLPMFRIGQFSGTRKSELYRMTWSMVDWKAGKIRSRQKGDRPHEIEITKEIYDILAGEFGNHPVYVFTFVAQANWRGRNSETGEMMVRNQGERYPYDHHSHWDRWQAVRKYAGSDVQWHAATRAFAIGQSGEANGEIATMEAIGIESPATYRRYAARHSDDRKRASLERIATPQFRAAAFTMPAPKLVVVSGKKAQSRHNARG